MSPKIKSIHVKFIQLSMDSLLYYYQKSKSFFGFLDSVLSPFFSLFVKVIRMSFKWNIGRMLPPRLYTKWCVIKCWWSTGGWWKHDCHSDWQYKECSWMSIKSFKLNIGYICCTKLNSTWHFFLTCLAFYHSPSWFQGSALWPPECHSTH